MNKKISELTELLVPKAIDYIVIVDGADNTTKKISIDHIIGTSVGDVKTSMLSPSQFSEVNYGTWLLMNGQSCVGTTYASLTGNTTVPDAVTEGRFIRQAKAGRSLASLESDAFQGHRHYQLQSGVTAKPISSTTALVSTRTAYENTGGHCGSDPSPDGVNGTPRTSNETRPTNIAANLYIRVV